MMDFSNREQIDIKDIPIAVLGMGKSGTSAGRLAHHLGAQVIVSDKNNNIEINENADELLSNGINVETGRHSKHIYDSSLWIISPGISKDSKIVKKGKNLGIPIIGEIEFASWFTNSPIISITGSNGKTTTVTALNKMCQTKNFKGFLGGNIGTPFSDNVLKELNGKDQKVIHILEISSFQMEYIHHFKPHICVFLNISADHLNRHGSIQEYIKMKLNMAKNLDKNDYIVYNSDDDVLRDCFNNHIAKKFPFSIDKSDTIISLNETKIVDLEGNILANKKDIIIPGEHNLLNLLAASTAAKLVKVPNQKIIDAFKSFSGVPHRLEKFLIKNNITYINDSKSTNLESVIVAIKSMIMPTILIMGGINKGSDFRLLLPYLKHSHVNLIITYGDAGGEILSAIGDAVRSFNKTDLNSAVKSAQSKATPGDTILLSPGCASFDQFKNFEDRGEKFKEIVRDINA